MTDLDRDIAELEARLRHLKKLRKSERISKALTGVKRSAEVRQRMSEASRKAWADPEVRQRMSEASKKAWADPEVRQRMSEARKKAWADPEVRQRMSEASKKAWAEKYEADLAPKRKRETTKVLPPVPLDPYEAMLFGGGAR